MTPTRLLLAGAVIAGMLGGVSAEARPMAHAMSLPAAARRDAIDHLRDASRELDRPAQAQRAITAAETALANGAEARGWSARPNRSPFRETIAARNAIQQGRSRRQDHVAIDRAIQAVRATA